MTTGAYYEEDALFSQIQACERRLKDLEEQLGRRTEEYETAKQRQALAYEKSLQTIDREYADAQGYFEHEKLKREEIIASNQATHQSIGDESKSKKSEIDEKLERLQTEDQKLREEQESEREKVIKPLQNALKLLQQKRKKFTEIYESKLATYKQDAASATEALDLRKTELTKELDSKEDAWNEVKAKIRAVSKQYKALDAGRVEAEKGYARAQEDYERAQKKYDAYTAQFKQVSHEQRERIREGNLGDEEKQSIEERLGKVEDAINADLNAAKKSFSDVEKTYESRKKELISLNEQGEALFQEKKEIQEAHEALKANLKQVELQYHEVAKSQSVHESRLEVDYSEAQIALEGECKQVRSNLLKAKDHWKVEEEKQVQAYQEAGLKLASMKAKLQKRSDDFKEKFDKAQYSCQEKLRKLESEQGVEKKRLEEQRIEVSRTEGAAQTQLLEAYEQDKGHLNQATLAERTRLEALEKRLAALEKKGRESRLKPVEGEWFVKASDVLARLHSIVKRDERFTDVIPLIEAVEAGVSGKEVTLSSEEQGRRIIEAVEAGVNGEEVTLSPEEQGRRNKFRRSRERTSSSDVLTLDERRARLKELLPLINRALMLNILERLKGVFSDSGAFADEEAHALIQQLKSVMSSNQDVDVVKRELLGNAEPHNSQDASSSPKTRLFDTLDSEITLVSSMKNLRAMLTSDQDFSIDDAAQLVDILRQKTLGDDDFTSVVDEHFARCEEPNLSKENVKIRIGSLLNQVEGDVKACREKGTRFQKFQLSERPYEPVEDVGLIDYVLDVLKRVVTMLMHPFGDKKQVVTPEVRLFKPAERQEAVDVLQELKKINTNLLIFNNKLLFSSDDELPRGFDKRR